MGSKFCAVFKKNSSGEIVCSETRSMLIPRLESIQRRKGYIADKDMQKLADELGIHPVEVYSVVTFYSFLSLQKEGKYVIRVSNCISNRMAGSKSIIRAFSKELKIGLGQTTKDGLFTLKETSCIGMCDQAPAIMINDRLIGNLTPAKVKEIIKEYKKKTRSK